MGLEISTYDFKGLNVTNAYVRVSAVMFSFENQSAQISLTVHSERGSPELDAHGIIAPLSDLESLVELSTENDVANRDTIYEWVKTREPNENEIDLRDSQDVFEELPK